MFKILDYTDVTFLPVSSKLRVINKLNKKTEGGENKIRFLQ